MGVRGLGMDERACGDAGAGIGQGCASIGLAWLGATSLALAVALWRGLVRILRRTRALSRILARNALQGARIASAWTAATSRALAITLRQWSAAAWTWTRLEARILARASLKGTRQASSWTAANSRTAAAALQRNVSAGAAWSGANAKAASRATLAAASASYSWAAHNLWQHLARRPACHAAGSRPNIAPWRSGAARRWSASNRSACTCR